MIPLWYGKANLVYHPLDLFEPGVRKATHIAHTVVVAEARERVIAAARRAKYPPQALIRALADLDALEVRTP